MKMSMEYPCVYFEKNGRCRKFSDDIAVSYCVMGPCPEQTLSNADRLSAMSDEEKAKEITMLFYQVAQKTNAKHYILDWLQQPAEEDS